MKLSDRIVVLLPAKTFVLTKTLDIGNTVLVGFDQRTGLATRRTDDVDILDLSFLHAFYEDRSA